MSLCHQGARFLKVNLCSVYTTQEVVICDFFGNAASRNNVPRLANSDRKVWFPDQLVPRVDILAAPIERNGKVAQGTVRHFSSVRCVVVHACVALVMRTASQFTLVTNLRELARQGSDR